MSTGSPLARLTPGPGPGAPAINASRDAGPTPAATICSYRVHVPARSGEDSARLGARVAPEARTRSAGGLGGAAAVAGGFGGVTAVRGGCEPNRRTASVTPASAAAVAVSSPVPDVDRISPALRTSAAKSAGWLTAIPVVTASRAACANSATRSATAPPPAELSARNVPASVWARSSRCVALRVGPAALGDLAGSVRDRRRRHLEQLRDRVADAGGGCDSRPADRADRLLDSLEEIRQRREIVERGETAERLQRFEDLLQRIMCDRIGAQRPSGAIERARDGRTLARDERARARVQPNRLRRSDLGRGARAELFELARQRLGFGGVRLRPARRLAHDDFEVIDRANGDLLRRRVPRAPALAPAGCAPADPHGRARDPLLACHERAAAERACQAHQLLRRRRGGRLEQRIEAVEILPRLEGEEVRHAEWRRGAWLSHGGTT